MWNYWLSYLHQPLTANNNLLSKQLKKQTNNRFCSCNKKINIPKKIITITITRLFRTTQGNSNNSKKLWLQAGHSFWYFVHLLRSVRDTCIVLSRQMGCMCAQKCIILYVPHLMNHSPPWSVLPSEWPHPRHWKLAERERQRDTERETCLKLDTWQTMTCGRQ